MFRAFVAWVLIALLFAACSGPEPDLLIGRWKVATVNRDGKVIAGPAFDGSVFEFKVDGTVVTESKMDTNTVKYRHEGDALIYLNGQLEERYRIDSLSESMLVIFSDADGVPTTTGMRRLETENQP